MTNRERFRRKISPHPYCPICKNKPESILHLLRDCPETCRYWRSVTTPETSMEFFQLDLHQWITKNIQSNEKIEPDLSWNTLFATRCWWGWKWRNNVAFQKEEAPGDIISFVRSQAKEFEVSWKSSTYWGEIDADKRITEQRWIPPREGTFKLNSDGCSKGNPGEAGGGGIFRNSSGLWYVGYACSMGHCSAIWAEMGAIRQGLIIATERGIKPLQIETDSKLAAQYLTDGVERGNPIAPIVNSCRNLISSLGLAEVVCCFRECNRVADWLANKALALPQGLHVFETPPEDCLSVLEGDKSQAIFV